jgi:hypothetical protein
MRKIKILLFMGVLCTAQLLWAQTRLVTGKITDEKDGLPIPGATVTVKNTNITTITDANGAFSIQAADNAVLVISYVGYAGVEVNASNASAIRLTQGNNALSEVVVVGYGQTLKRELTSSVTRVKGSEVANTPVANFNQALQGRAAGVFVESNNGKVGEG